jgi:hypothetical protein
MAAQDKQKALVDSISEGVQAKLAVEFSKLGDEIAKLQVSLNSCNARLATLEQTVSSGATTAKRAVRAGGAKAGAGAKKPPGKGKNGGSDASKVTNSLLYFRHAMAHNLDEYQDIYGVEENLLEADKDPTVGKRDKNKDAIGYWSAVGAALWKNVLSEEQKEEVRSAYNAWKEQSTRDESEDQLDVVDDAT